MPKKCKDCDPNKYIEGLAYRGKNGLSFDNYKTYNDVGKPSSTDIAIADVSDLVDAYNPIFTATKGSPLPESLNNEVKITGVDESKGFYFVWSFINGLVMYGTPGINLSPVIITSSGTTTAQIGQSFNFNIVLDSIPSYLTFTGFEKLKDLNTNDELKFSQQSSSTIPFVKSKINYVGYFTGKIISTLNGVNEVFSASKTLTIKCTDINGNDPIYVTSAPTKSAFTGTNFSYTLTTNLGSFEADLDSSSLDILSNLNLVWNKASKTITGTVSNNLPSKIQNANLNFTINGPNADAGNRKNFTLSLLYGTIDNSLILPTISSKSFTGTVDLNFNDTLVGLNNTETIVGISNLPEGLIFNSSSKSITGTPKHAGTFLAYANCSNAKGSSSLVTLTFNIEAASTNNQSARSTFPSEIKLPSWDANVIKNNSITLSLNSIGPWGGATIYFKKINTSEIETIRKNGQPDNITHIGNSVPETIFFPGKGLAAESCFWVKFIDGVKNTNNGVTIKGNYAIKYSDSAQKDLIGNICYAPDTAQSGPASTPFTESLNVTATNTIKGGLSGNPAENVPAISISPTQIEHQVVFDIGLGTLDTTSSFATQKLSKSGLLKYPNGIPNQNDRTYLFYVQLADTCAFNKTTQKFALYIGTYSPRAGDVYLCNYQGYQLVKRWRYMTRQYYNYNANYTLVGAGVPGNCFAVVSQAGSSQTINDYGYRYANSLKESKDVGISSLTNISLLDVLGEGPIEGIVDYEILPNPGYGIGDIGYKNGVKIVKYPGKNSIVRSIFWNEVPLADNTYPNAGSVNFEFVKFAFDNADSAPRHTNINELENIKLEEPFYSKKYNNGQYLESFSAFDNLDAKTISSKIKLPTKLTSTKTVGAKLFGKRKFQDGKERTYKKSITILNKDLYALKLHIKALSLFKTISDLTIWDTADQAAANSVAGRMDRLDMTFNLFLKRIDYIPNKGKEVTLIANPDYKPSNVEPYTINQQDYYDQFWRPNNDPLSLYWPPNDPGGPGNGPDGYQRQPANFSQFYAGYTTYSHRHDGKVYASYARDVNKLQKDFNISLQDHIDKRRRAQAGGGGADFVTLSIVGKLTGGPFIETFEWSGLDKYTKSTTVGWEIEVEPTYTESVDQNIVLKSGIDSITEIYDDFLSLPHTAGFLTTFDSRFFSSIPQRAYDTRLLKVKVPSNYNPFSKTYNGAWDGNFNLAWTDNPAWCFYDIITNRRFGLGKFIDPNLTDKWTLYEIGQYCDQLVSDGKGGLEPRFTCNVLISTREDAYKVVNDMASIFRAITFYNAGLIFTSQDRPKESLYIFNNSNVKDGEFTYSNTSKRVRRNVILVRYNDKENFYKPAVKYVENKEGLIRFGIKEMDVSAFGCTSEGQAERLGKWTLLSENLEAELVTFETSLPAMYLKPGDITLIQDQNRQNKILGGRTFELNKNYAILDIQYADISGYLPALNACNFNVLTPAGNIEVGTETGNSLINYTGPNINLTINNGLYTSLIRKKQVQTIKFESNYTVTGSKDTNVFGNYVSLITGGSFAGYTKINFAGQELNNTEHTLIQNTVWTIEIEPDNYDYNKSPSVSGLSDPNRYPGASLEPYIDKTQKFRILDIEEQDEFKYRITALQYDENKFTLGDNI